MKLVKNLVPLVIFISLNFFLSCGEKTVHCSYAVSTSKNLWEGFKSKIPYKGNDTLNFVDSANDILTFVGQGVDSGYICQYVTVDPDCPANKYCYQYFYFKFKEIKGQSDFGIGIYSNVSITSFDDYRMDMFGVNFNKLTFYDQLSLLGDKTTPRYYDSLSIGNTIYYDLLKTPLTFQDTISYILTNTKNGVICINTPNSRFNLIK